MEIITVYDNIANDPQFKTDWGYACVIDHPKKRILFDTGEHAIILEKNLHTALIPIKSIDILILSHLHSDHIGGANWVVEQNPNITVYIPDTFSKNLENQLRLHCNNIIRVKKSISFAQDDFHVILTKNVWIKEISLVIATQQGGILISGCSHSGIDHILDEARKYTKQDIFTIFGGLHLLKSSDQSITKISQKLKNSHLKQIAPCHCTGDQALTLLKENFADNFLTNGVGAKFNF